MFKRSIITITVLLFAVPMAISIFGRSLPASSGAIEGERAGDFELKDQYGNSSIYRFPKQKVTVLAFGDRKGAQQIEGWVRPLWDRYQTRIDQQGVAVLSSVPPFARGVVKRIFKAQIKYSVLLDWTGEVSRVYSYRSGKANLYVIDRDGKIVMKVIGPASQSDLQLVYKEIDRLLQ